MIIHLYLKMSYSIAIGTYVEARNKVQLSLLYMLNVNVSVIEFAWRKMSQNYPNSAVGFLSMNIEMEKNRPYFVYTIWHSIGDCYM